MLGNGSATPTLSRNPAGQVLRYGSDLLLLDCGEGTLLQLLRYKVATRHLSHVLISHLHGDHIFGLPGLLTSWSLTGRTAPLHLYGPPGLADILTTLFRHSATHLHFPLHFQPIHPDREQLLTEVNGLQVTALPLQHRVPCSGFLLTETRPERHLLPPALNLPYPIRQALKQGRELPGQAQPLGPEAYTRTDSPRAYAYCTDTLYLPTLAERLRGVTLLYHEATFAEADAHRAGPTFHSTARQAAVLARAAGVNRLLLGHFSARYSDLSLLENEARSLFAPTDAARQGQWYQVG